MTDALIEKVARAIYPILSQSDAYPAAAFSRAKEASRAAVAAIEESGTHIIFETAHIKEFFRQMAILMREMGLHAEADQLDADAGIDTRRPETP